MPPSANVIEFPVRARWHPPASIDDAGPEPAARPPRVPKLKPVLLLLAPLIGIGSLVSFVAVVGVFLVWLLIVSMLVVGVVLFARRLFSPSAALRVGGFRHRPIG
jgi:hypothetical protein